MQINYREYIENKVKEFGWDEPIYVSDLVKELHGKTDIDIKKLRKIVSNNLSKLVVKGVIKHMSYGIYYNPDMTIFGETYPPVGKVVKRRYLVDENGNTIGYVTSYDLLHRIGLCSMMPRDTIYATNNYSLKLPKGKNCLQLVKPVTKINNENVRYLEVLDAIAMLDCGFVDAPNPTDVIMWAINLYKLDKKELIRTAEKYYPKVVVDTILNKILEDNYEITRK